MRIAHLAITIPLALGLALQAGSAQAGLLDIVPGAAAAYSLRQLRDGYGGPAIQVRSSAGGGLQTIGFDATGQLDTTALLNAVGPGNNGFVVTWYDQVGSTHVTQGTTSLQPLIVTGGALVTDPVNGLPAIRFQNNALNYIADVSNGTMSVLTAASWIGVPSSNDSVAQRLWTMRAGTSTRAAAGANSNNFAFSRATNPAPSHGAVTTGTAVVANEPFVLSYLYDNTLSGTSDFVRLRLDGSQIGGVTGDFGIAGVTDFTVGAHNPNERRFNGLMQELIVYHTVLSGSSLVLAEGNMMNVYIPEPASLLLLLSGGIAVLGRRRRRR